MKVFYIAHVVEDFTLWASSWRKVKVVCGALVVMEHVQWSPTDAAIKREHALAYQLRRGIWEAASTDVKRRRMYKPWESALARSPSKRRASVDSFLGHVPKWNDNSLTNTRNLVQTGNGPALAGQVTLDQTAQTEQKGTKVTERGGNFLSARSQSRPGLWRTVHLQKLRFRNERILNGISLLQV